MWTGLSRVECDARLHSGDAVSLFPVPDLHITAITQRGAPGTNDQTTRSVGQSSRLSDVDNASPDVDIAAALEKKQVYLRAGGNCLQSSPRCSS